MLQLFWVFFKIGLFSIGGGYAMIPLIRQEMVSGGYMTLPEVTDMIAISQMTPGPIAVNAATFVGMRAMGVPGAVIATAGVVLPCALISIIVARFFFKNMEARPVQAALYGMRPVVLGLIAGTAATFTYSSLLAASGAVDLAALLLFAALLAVSLIKDISPALLILASAVAGLVLFKP